MEGSDSMCVTGYVRGTKDGAMGCGMSVSAVVLCCVADRLPTETGVESYSVGEGVAHGE